MPGLNTHLSQGATRVPHVEEEPMSAPIWQVADYAYESAEHYTEVIHERRPGQVYGRYGNPTLEALASLLAEIEHAESAWIFSSGMGAMHAALMSLVKPGSTLVCGKTLYGGTYGLLTGTLEELGVKVEFADVTSGNARGWISDEAAAVLVETVANPTLEVSDVRAIAAVCRERDIPLIVDNTVATPVLCNPLSLGATLVVHSTSKYIGGHHDLMGGAVCGDAGIVDRVRHLGISFGTTASAFESWLALRGAATLGLRMERHSANALAVARFLESSGAVERVLYLGLESHPGHSALGRTIRAGGGLVAADFGTQERAWKFVDGCRVARVGSSFGGVRTELTHPATTSHRQFTPDDRRVAGIGDGLIRMSIGIEDEADLLADFKSALEGLP